MLCVLIPVCLFCGCLVFVLFSVWSARGFVFVVLCCCLEFDLICYLVLVVLVVWLDLDLFVVGFLYCLNVLLELVMFAYCRLCF